MALYSALSQRKGRTLAIRYTVGACRLGRLLLAATEHGVCSVSLGDREDSLPGALRQEYPAAEVRRDDPGLQTWLALLLDHLNGRQQSLDLPLSLWPTPFQWRVWQELRKIPYGSTRTYGEVAAALGQPKAVRAVARACATNPVAVVIPCHRVIREDGSLGGYRWGIERKEKMLAQEKAAVSRK